MLGLAHISLDKYLFDSLPAPVCPKVNRLMEKARFLSEFGHPFPKNINFFATIAQNPTKDSSRRGRTWGSLPTRRFLEAEVVFKKSFDVFQLSVNR